MEVNKMLGEVLRPLKNLIIIMIVLLFFLLLHVNNNYYQNAFEVSINNKPIHVYYDEKFLRGPLPPIIGAYNQRTQSNDISPVVNEVEYSNTLNLTINEYEVYWKDTNERSYDNKVWHRQDRFSYKEISLHKANMIIKRKNKYIYDGSYIEDISTYVNEPGRYYFQIMITRKDNFYTSIKTHMTFNIIVNGGHKDE
jgi:hypothetical protein